RLVYCCAKFAAVVLTGGSTDNLPPQGLALSQRFLDDAHCVGIECRQRCPFEIRRDQRRQSVQALDLGDAWNAVIGPSDVVQSVDHQALGDRGTAVDQTAHLQVQARKDTLEIGVDSELACGERLEQATHHPPEAAREAAQRKLLDVG